MQSFDTLSGKLKSGVDQYSANPRDISSDNVISIIGLKSYQKLHGDTNKAFEKNPSAYPKTARNKFIDFMIIDVLADPTSDLKTRSGNIVNDTKLFDNILKT